MVMMLVAFHFHVQIPTVIQSLSKGVNGVSFLYQISDQSLDELLDELESDSFITINRTAGLNVIYLKNKDLCEHDVLRLCYD